MHRFIYLLKTIQLKLIIFFSFSLLQAQRINIQFKNMAGIAQYHRLPWEQTYMVYIA